MKSKTCLVASLFVAVGLLCGLACGAAVFLIASNLDWQGLLQTIEANNAGPAVGELAPDFELQNLDGETIRLSELRGQPVLLNFWATWCGPCKLEMPVFQQSNIENPGLLIVAVNGGDAATTVQDFANKQGLTFAILLDEDESVTYHYGIHAIPTSYFLDANGTIRIVHIGSMDDSDLQKYLEKIGIK